MKILLVDDHKLIGKSLEMTLKNYADVKEFRYISDPITVFEMIETYRPSIILMDIHMGMFNGLELGEEVLRKTKTKLVFLSGFDLAEYRDKAIGIGANGFLDKHIAVDSLIENLKKISYEDKKIFPQTSIILFQIIFIILFITFRHNTLMLLTRMQQFEYLVPPFYPLVSHLSLLEVPYYIFLIQPHNVIYVSLPND